MKATLVSIAAVALVMIGVSARAQEVVTPVAVPATAVVQPAAKVVATPYGWRYRWYGDRWWYWTPQNQWMWYGDGRWNAYLSPAAPSVVYSPTVPVYPSYSYYPYGYYQYPYYGYYGPRVAVNVWGGRGFVRAGRWGYVW